ncbi:MAG: CPBP family intramembrane metalloprotease [Planctomycetes bacterium]|nr:CPBP family intramembrane metalloprotease [Planctomycetota bacterium]
MDTSDLTPNNGMPPKRDLDELKLEPVDVSELNLDDVPVVESVPSRLPGLGFGKALLWCLLFILVTQGVPSILMAFVIIVSTVSGSIKPDLATDWISSPEARPYIQWTLFAGQLISILFSMVILRWVVGREWKRKIALRLPCAEHMVLLMIAVPALLMLSITLEPFVVRYVPSLTKVGLPSVESFIQSTKSWHWSVGVLIIGLGPALGEELWCRGFLGQGLASRYGKWGGVLLASFLFGLIHVEPPQAVMACIFGLIFHLTYLATRSIFAPMLLHFLNNSLVILALSENGSVPVVTSLENAYFFRQGLSVSAALLVLIAVGLILYQSRVRIWTPEGLEAPPSLYPNVEVPAKGSANVALPGPFAMLEVGALLIAVGLFAAIWFGL